MLDVMQSFELVDQWILQNQIGTSLATSIKSDGLSCKLISKFDTFWAHYFLLQALELTKEDDDLTRDNVTKKTLMQKKR